MDYPRAEIMRLATEAIAKNGGPTWARVYFSTTCPRCGERNLFVDANMLWEQADCGTCGARYDVAAAGFALELGLRRGDAHGA
jgi:uncharacterized protein (DUF983 family)